MANFTVNPITKFPTDEATERVQTDSLKEINAALVAYEQAHDEHIKAKALVEEKQELFRKWANDPGLEEAAKHGLDQLNKLTVEIDEKLRMIQLLTTEAEQLKAQTLPQSVK